MGITEVTAAQSARTGYWDYIDALRGIAAFGVLSLHTLILFPQLPLPISQIARLGLHGVQLFFMLSAITLSSSWKSREQHENKPVLAFFIRRFFRIAPMFWASIVGYMLLDEVIAPFWANQGEVTPIAALLTWLFLHGWLPQTINVVVPGGWSIADEMTFYLIFPLLISYITSLAGASLFFVVSIVMTLMSNWLALGLYGPQHPHLLQFIYYWLPNQLPIFAMGFMTFYLIPLARGISRLMSIVLLGFAIALLFAIAFGSLPYSADISHPTIWRDLPAGAAFMALILSLAARPSKLFVNRGTKLLGRVSFSSYLLQFAVIETILKLFGPMQLSGVKAISMFVMTLLFLSGINTLLATATYRLIEKPWIKIGHKLASLFVLRQGRITSNNSLSLT